MRVFLLIMILTGYSVNELKAQKTRFHVNGNHEYSVLIDQNTEISTKNIENGSITYFVVNDSRSIFKYYFSVSKFPLKESIDIYGNDYISSFKKECFCKILTIEESNNNNVKGIKITIEANKQGKRLAGYSFASLTNKNVLYNITFLTRNEDLNLYKKYFKRFINSLVINSSR